MFLGTGAAIPSRTKGTSAIAIRSGREIVLMDCGEGTQRQLMISPFSFMKIKTILITHLHGDHVFGLVGLIQTMDMSGRTEPLNIYGPPGLAKLVGSVRDSTENDGINYDLNIIEVTGGESFTEGRFKIEAYGTVHTVPSVGYVVTEPDIPGALNVSKAHSLGINGRGLGMLKNGQTVGGVKPSDVIGPAIHGMKVSYTGDTAPSDVVCESSKGADVLIHESTYMDSEAELSAKHLHSTARQAADVALKSGVRYLILTHLSNRYDNPDAVRSEACDVFPNTYVANDFDLYRVNHKGIFLESKDII